MQQQIQMLTKKEISTWTWLVSRGIANAMSGLSRMVGQKFSVTALDIRQIPARDAAGLLGGPENTVVGSCQTINGDATGCLMLIHEPQIAFELVDMQMGLEMGTTRTLEEIERSTLEEISNITGSFFLNALANSTDLRLAPSPPQIMINTVGEVLDSSLAEVMQEENILVIKITFGTAGRLIEGVFLVMPTLDFMKMMIHSYTASLP